MSPPHSPSSFLRPIVHFLVVLFLAGLPARASESATAPAQAFIGDWGLRMHNGDAGWLSIERSNEGWACQLWTVGQTKAIADVRYADGKLRFKRSCKIGEPEFPGGPATGRILQCEFVAEVKGDAIWLEMGLPSAGSGKPIDNQPIRGNINGAFQAGFTVPGPLYLQGDHTAVSYRNSVFRPVLERAARPQQDS